MVNITPQIEIIALWYCLFIILNNIECNLWLNLYQCFLITQIAGNYYKQTFTMNSLTINSTHFIIVLDLSHYANVNSQNLLTFSSKINTSQSLVWQHNLRQFSLSSTSASMIYLAPRAKESWVLIILSLWTSKLSMHICKPPGGNLSFCLNKLSLLTLLMIIRNSMIRQSMLLSIAVDKLLVYVDV